MAITDDLAPSDDNSQCQEFRFIDEALFDWLIVTDRQENGQYYAAVYLEYADESSFDSHDHPTVTDAVQAAIAYILED